MIFVMVLLGSRRTEIGYESGGELIYELVKIFITGIVVAVIEEIFFRGFILQSLLRDLGRGTAVFWTSFFFAIVHFFKAPDMPETSGFNALIGFQSLFYFFQPLLSPTEVIPGFIGLFLVGTVLAYARLWTGSLYIAIGLHAGWVFVIKAEGLFLDRLNVVAPWFFGDGWVVTGIFGWIMALVILAILYVQVGRRPDNRT
jgi:membrane protease YdiL (CAAX protease family)